MKKTAMLFLIAFFSCSLAFGATNYYPKGTPTRAIQDLDDTLENFHMGKLTPEQKEENAELKKKIIRGTFNIRELSRLALAKHWDILTTKQQDEFVQVLMDILEEKALFSKEQLATKTKKAKKYNVAYNGHKLLNADGSSSFVRTRVVIPTENISINLNYKLKKLDGEWRIFDVIVDEASLVENYRYQFNSIITKNGYSELLRRMKEKLEEIRSKRKSADE